MASANPQQTAEGRRHRVVLIRCDPGQPPGFCDDLVRRLVELGEFEVIVHAREPHPDDGGGRAAQPGQVRASAEPLERLFPDADIFVCGGLGSLVLGCGAGLKPVQIGSTLEGCDQFSHVFPDIGSFVAAAPGLRGELSLGEYESFRRSRLDAAVSDGTRGGLWAGLRQASKSIGITIANPVAVLRFVHNVVSEWSARSG